MSETQAQFKIAQHAAPFALEAVDGGALQYVPMAKTGAYEFRLAWAVPVSVVGDMGSWEGLVDAASGELLAFEDRNHYSRRVIGGVYPISNDQRPPDGVEQTGWPMPFADISGGGGFTNANGLVACSVAGARTTALNGQFVRMQDACGAISESNTGDIDLGSGPTAAATDCVVPAGRSAGDTKSSRSGMYELNRIKEQARGYLPTNAWLQAQLPANMNINLTCNAFWSTAAGTVNFYRDNGSQCRNTGEIAAIFDHEWGHGMDANGVAAGVSQPGEGIADIHAFLRLQTSCIARGFFKNQVCTGYGDACDGTPATGCTGIREIDFQLRRCNLPHTVTYIQSGFTAAQCPPGGAPACPAGGGTPCGRATHCEGSVVGETAFDLARRDLTAAPFLMDSNTAHEISTRLWTIGAGPVQAWYTCAVGGGCAATGGYLNILAVDDDNGNLTDGTPHMTAIRAAFERHEIHCPTPAPLNVGCATGPVLPTVLTVTPGLESASLSWTPVPNAARYNVYRTEGVFGCNFGKIKIADVTTTSFNDTGLLGGRPVSYMVMPVGTSPSCFGPASNCTAVTPTADACPLIADYSLSCSPSTMTTNPGGTGNSSCTVQSLNAFSSAVTMACTGLPAGATCAYNPNPVTPAPNGAVSSALTVSVGAGVPAGTYNFQATGTSGALTRTFPMTLNVIVPNFALSCAPASLTVNQNSSGNSTCTVQSQNAFASAVTMSCTGLPAGATCAYVPPTVTPAPNGAATSTLTVTVGGTVAPGTYNFQARGTSGALVQTFNMTLIVTSFSVAPFALAVDPAGNGVYQPNELVEVAPTWRNTGQQAIALSGVLSNHTGPAGPTYTVVDSAASYGTIAAGNNASCGANCYIVGNTTASRPMTHWDSTALETVTPTGTTKTWTLHIGNSFAEVPPSSPFFRFIEMLLHRGVTGGCTATNYCPSASTTREQMAVFVILSKEPPGYVPPACVAGSEVFADVPASSPFCRWIEELARRGVVSGCGGGNYCPGNPVTREQMAVFVLRTLDPTLNPPACAPPNLYGDVPESSPFCRWIEELTNRGVVTGCGGGNYCPADAVTREQMGVFLAVTFGLTLYGL